MQKQKYIFKSKTVWSAILTLLIAVLPQILEGVNSEFSIELWKEILSLTVATLWTIYNRYIASGTLYTPNGLPGRDYQSVYRG